jgi:hypothetical protein
MSARGAFGGRRRAGAAVVLAAVTLLPVGPALAAPATGHRLPAAPPDFVTLTDDTNALTISVPAAWTDVDTTPGTNDDGTVMPWISASTDFAAYRETFDVPGALFIGVSYTTDLQSWIDRVGQPTSACPTSSSEPYDDGAFVGLATVFEQCGPTGQASLLVVAANAGDDTTRTYVVQIQAPTEADVALFAPILASFNAIGITSTVGAEDEAPAAEAPAEAPQGTTAITPVTLPDGTPLVPATAPGQEGPAPSAPTGPFTPTGSLAEGALQVTDDSRSITVAVPPDWLETATTASPEGAPQILAAPQLAGFAPGGVAGQTFSGAGVRYTARPFTADTAAAVSASAAGLPCTPGEVQPYEDPVFTGHILQLTDCGGTTTRIYLVEANPADASLTASLLIQITDIDDSDLQTLLSSFDIAREDTPSPSTVAVPTTAAGVTTTAVVAPTTAALPATTMAAVPTTAVVAPTAAPTTLAAVTPSSVAVPTSAAGPSGVFSPSVDIPPGTESVVDDTGFLRVGVPPIWTSRSTAPIQGLDGNTYPYIAAAADVGLFLQPVNGTLNANGGSGVVYQASLFRADTDVYLSELTVISGCTQGLIQPYADAVFTGHIQELTACGGTQTRRYYVAANPADGRFTAVVVVQVTDDPSVLNTVLATFDYDPAGSAPGEPA